MRALSEAALQVLVHGGEFGLDIASSRQLTFQLARAARDAGVQQQHADQRARDGGREQSKHRELQA
jgi:hypothetical protein